jgi:hypothetical protein
MAQNASDRPEETGPTPDGPTPGDATPGGATPDGAMSGGATPDGVTPTGPMPTGPKPTGARWKPDWRDAGKRLLGVVGVIVGVWLIYLFLSAFLPRWWAQVIGNAVDGSFGAGAWWGLMVGLVFTVVPVLFLAQAVLTRRSWQVRVALVVVAALFAVPNLLTLGIVLGTSAAAHAGERILDVDAPAFRGGSAWGAAIGGVIALVIVTMGVLYRRRGARLRELRAKQK